MRHKIEVESFVYIIAEKLQLFIVSIYNAIKKIVDL